MCGIIAVLGQRTDREPPTRADLIAAVDRAIGMLADQPPPSELANAVSAAAAQMAEVDRLLHGSPGVLAVLGDPGLAEDLEARLHRLAALRTSIDNGLDDGTLAVPSGDLEAVNAALLALNDTLWAVSRDRLRTAREVASLAGGEPSVNAVDGYLAIQLALSALDRLEVRGRDSAGIHVLVANSAFAANEQLRSALAGRSDPLFVDGTVRVANGCLGFVYKAAAEIGELGDNTAHLRKAISEDGLLRSALTAADNVTVLGHTRWASVGIISEPNAHPLNSDEVDTAAADASRPYFVGALNGDVDNYVELKSQSKLHIAGEITTDAKVIPTLVARRVAAGTELVEAFTTTVKEFDGSVAIGVSSADDPDRLLLALRGSGQALYVGLAEDMFVVASEPYGVVEETPVYLRMDGEAPGGLDHASGQVVVLDRSRAGSIDGISRLAYGGTEIPIAESDLVSAEITTRDIDRGGYPHFLLKEIGEAPQSVRKTLRGKIEETRGLLAVQLPEETLPPLLIDRFVAGEIRRIVVTGQGTAAVAGQAAAAAIADAFSGTDVSVVAMTAAELSGFGLAGSGMADDMTDTLVVAISQSGTSTDTNRTIDLCRARGAIAIGIVNRRNSDLVDKADGVLYTSDGRDVEMAVPSTKAFYAQIAAGVLLAWGLAAAAGTGDRHRAAELLAALRLLPDAMDDVLTHRDSIAQIAQRHALSRRYWAMVGNGPNRVAAEELRIKLSELCYKSIACDITEDKKHIDLSSEPLIVVCAAGLDGANADDVSKEIAIFRAHKAAPIVIASAGETRFDAALDVIAVPRVHPELDFVLSAMAGHLFGYEAAVAIDAQAKQLRELRGAVEDLLTSGGQDPDLLARLAPAVARPTDRFFADLRSGSFNGNLAAATAVRLASLLRYARGAAPLDAYEVEYGKVGSPGALVDDLLDALSDAIDELTRPIDAIKHQAKTVTVGISRAEESFAEIALVQEVLAAGVGRDRVGYRALRTLAELDPAVVAVKGYSRYQVEGDVVEGKATIHRIDSGGIARELASRTDSDPALKGTKRRAAFEREVTVSRSNHDGRTTVIIPETKDNQVTGITLLHVDLVDRLPAADARKVLTGYRNRYNAIVDAVTETEPAFTDEILGEVSFVDLLVEPVRELASHWRS